MTKTESANRTVQAVVIEACEQLLECQMAEGVRLAIPNTNNLIMVGPQEWIAENVLAVEAMVGREPAHIPQTADEVIAFIGNHYDSMEQRDDDTETRFQLSVHDLLSAFRWWFDTDLAATTQASTAQADLAGYFVWEEGCWVAASSDWPGAVKLYRATTSSTDAQAAAEVRDAERYRFLREKMCFSGGKDKQTTMTMRALIPAPDHDLHKDWMGERFDTSVDATVDRAIRSAGDTGEQADGGA